MDWKEVVMNIAVIGTILQFLSGIPVCRDYIAFKTTGDSSELPFLGGIVSCAIWLLYGFHKPDNKIFFVNTIGVSCSFAYIAVFLMYTNRRISILKKVSVSVLLTLLTIGYIEQLTDEEILNHLGSLGSALTLLTIAAPLSKLSFVIKTKSTECLPFPMIIVTFFVSLLWFFYGVVTEDKYLLVPNLVGCVLGVCQLSLFVIYPNKPKSTLLIPKSSIA